MDISAAKLRRIPTYDELKLSELSLIFGSDSAPTLPKHREGPHVEFRRNLTHLWSEPLGLDQREEMN